MRQWLFKTQPPQTLFYKGAKVMTHYFFTCDFVCFFPFVLFRAFTLMLITFTLLLPAFALILLALSIIISCSCFHMIEFYFFCVIIVIFALLFLVFGYYFLQLHNIVQVFAPKHCCCMVLFKYLFFCFIIELSFVVLFLAFVLLLCPPFML